MMNFIRAICFFLITQNLFSQEIKPQLKQRSYVFQQMSIPDFIASAYGDVLELSYAISPDILNTDKKVVAYITPGLSLPQFKIVADEYLLSLGISSISKGQVLFFSISPESKSIAPKLEIEIYHPIHRTSSFLTESAFALFPDVNFSSKRSIRNTSPSTPLSSLSQLNKQSPPTSQQKISTPASALDQIDKDSDTIIFQGTKDDLNAVLKFFARIDKPVKQVVVKAFLYEVQKTLDNANAIQLAGSLLGSKFGINLSSGFNQNTSGAASITFNSASFEAALSVLGSDSHFKLLSSPVLRVKSGATATFNVGSDVPTLSSTSRDSQGNLIQSVEYQASGVIFKITPVVKVESVDLDVDQELSSFATTTTGVNASPTRLRRQLQTSLSITSSDVVLMGGLEVNQSSLSQTGLRLPTFLRSSSDSETQSSLLLVLSATII